MDRRTFLKLLGITPLAPLLAKLPAFPEPEVFAEIEEDTAVTTWEDEASRDYVNSGNTQEFSLDNQATKAISANVERDVSPDLVYGRSHGNLDVTIGANSSLFEYVNSQGHDACTIIAEMNGHRYRFVDCWPVSWSRSGNWATASFVFSYVEISR